MSHFPRPSALLGLVALLLAAGCDLTGAGAGAPATLEPATIPAVLTVGETITVAVTVRDKDTRPVPGVAVSWTPSAGTSVDPAVGDTNENGVAFTRWSLGPTPGEHTLTARTGSLEVTVTTTTRDDP